MLGFMRRMCFQCHSRGKNRTKRQNNTSPQFFFRHTATRNGGMHLLGGESCSDRCVKSSSRQRSRCRLPPLRKLQVNQNFLTQGPAPSFGPTDIIQSRDAPPNGTCCRRGRTRRRRPRGCEHALYRHAGRRNLEDDERRNDLEAAHRQAGVALDFESRLRSHRRHPQHFDRGHGPHLQWDRLSRLCFFTASGGLRNGLLYSQDGGNTWTSLGAGTLANESVAGVAARGNVLVAGTYEISGFGGR